MPRSTSLGRSHANYDNRNTGWNDALSQLTDNAFRSQDWWYLPQRGKFLFSCEMHSALLSKTPRPRRLTYLAGDYLRADRSTSLGQLLEASAGVTRAATPQRPRWAVPGFVGDCVGCIF